MNFLEQLAAQWYEYRGYFARTNIRFGQTGHGGHIGEMDVVAYHPGSLELVHLELSTDAWSYREKKERFKKKFLRAAKYYKKLFPFPKNKISRVAVTGFSRPKNKSDLDFGPGIEVITVPSFISGIARELSKLDPWRVGLHEGSYPLLRAIQYGTFYLNYKR